MNQLITLLTSRRFAPMFGVQFLGAFTDNVFKSALLIMITYKFAQELGMQASILNMAAAGLFILPFFLFSAFGGLLADKYEKNRLIRYIKAFEMLVLLTAAYAFMQEDVWLLFICLGLAGLQSALFGPSKYGILPELLPRNELLSGNALIEAGTFLAILLGTIVGGLTILSTQGSQHVSTILLVCAGLGWSMSFLIPKLQRANPSIKLGANFIKQTYDIYKLGTDEWHIKRLVFGISWFWFLGYVIQSQINPLTADVYHAGEDVAVLALVMFTVGIGCGSILCSRILKGDISARYVPFAALAMSIFSLDLYLASHQIAQQATPEKLYSLNEFIRHPLHWRAFFDMLMLAISAGFYIVPLYTLLQHRVQNVRRSRTVAANNISNAMFMVLASVLVIAVLKQGFTIPDLFWMLAILNILVALFIMKIIPRDSMKTLGRFLFRVLYRVEVRGLDNYPRDEGQYVIVPNHTSYLDGPLLMSYLPDMPVFAINTDVNNKWWVRIFTQFYEMFPLDSTQPMAIKGLIKMLREGRRVVIFPEGRITNTGSLMKIYEGSGKIAELGRAKLIPVRIDGAQLTKFGRLQGQVKQRLIPKITITVCPPVDVQIPHDLHGDEKKYALRRAVYDVMTDMIYRTSDINCTLYKVLTNSIKVHGGGKEILEDLQRTPINLNKLLLGSVVLGRGLGREIRDEQPVGMLLPNAIATVVTFYALQALGKVPAMLNFTVGEHSLLSAIKTAEIKTVLTSRKFIEVAQLEGLETMLKQNVELIYLEDIKNKLGIMDKLVGLFKANTGYGLLSRQRKPQDPAVILFTSGSEGTPKGVVLSHKNLISNQAQVKACLDFSSNDRFFNALPVFHSFGLGVGLVLPISSGIRTFLYPSPLHYKIVPELVYDTQTTVVFGTDTFLSGYARHGDTEDFQYTRYVIAGAEKLKASTREKWMSKFGVRIFEGYGVTETSPALSINNYSHYKEGTVGRLFPGIEARLENVPGIAQGGRLYVKGENIMLGYLRAEAPGELHPPEDQWHDTGDIVDIDDEGFITILGRAKRFAKIGGEMVSLTNVEEWISTLWPHEQHCVCAVADARKGEKLVLVTTHADAARKEIMEYFSARGGNELMVPREILVLKEIPVLGTGKLNYPEIQNLANKHYAS